MSSVEEDASDAYVEALKASRDGSSVLKMDLINLRAKLPADLPIFVFEGDDDKAVYFHWTKRLDDGFEYEPFVCKGKPRVLQLKESVEKDKGGLKHRVYFFVDRDFDDLQGVQPYDLLYMTDTYSVENCLVSEGVLEEVLKIEFHCHAVPDVRQRVKAEFGRIYGEFLIETRDLNRELYAARRIPVRLTAQLPERIGQFAVVSVDAARRNGRPVAELVRTVRPITEPEHDALASEFDQLDASTRYRGKFSLMFFLKWIEALAAERTTQGSVPCKGTRAGVPVRPAEKTIGNLASKAKIPDSFEHFFSTVVNAT